MAALLQSDERIPGVQVFKNYFCRLITWQIQAESHKNDYPLAANAIRIETLLDDLMLSVLTVEEVQETRDQLSGLRDQPQFHIRTEWLYNWTKDLEDIPVADLASKVDLNKSNFPITKELGALWSAGEDALFFRCEQPPVIISNLPCAMYQ